jgi:hypothetical protein
MCFALIWREKTAKKASFLNFPEFLRTFVVSSEKQGFSGWNSMRRFQHRVTTVVEGSPRIRPDPRISRQNPQKNSHKKTQSSRKCCRVWSAV